MARQMQGLQEVRILEHRETMPFHQYQHFKDQQGALGLLEDKLRESFSHHIAQEYSSLLEPVVMFGEGTWKRVSEVSEDELEVPGSQVKLQARAYVIDTHEVPEYRNPKNIVKRFLREEMPDALQHYLPHAVYGELESRLTVLVAKLIGVDIEVRDPYGEA